MRIVIALGGNALLRRGEPLTAENQRANIQTAARRIAAVVPGNQIVVAHGNGPRSIRSGGRCIDHYRVIRLLTGS